VVEAVLLLLATLWSQFGEIELLPLFRLNRNIVAIGLLSGVVTASTGFILLWLAYIFGQSIKWLEALRKIVVEELTPLFQTLNVADIFLVAASSGFCEEIFFRGVIQNQLGLWLSAALFGFFHCPTPRHLPYGIWALCAGTFLGWLLIQTGSIWTPIFAHALSNFLVLLFLRYGRKAASDESSNSKADGPSAFPAPQESTTAGNSSPKTPKLSTPSAPTTSQDVKAAEPPLTNGESGESHLANPKSTDKPASPRS
jgi:membrane protease YdiL (CAAX protease family)